jgi:hypothetical protein
MSINDPSSPLKEIIAELDRSTQIDRSTFVHWLQTNDIEAMGALMDLLAAEGHSQRVQPPLTFLDIYPFVKNYYERILLENPDGEWSDSRTTAGWNFAKWFVQLWEDDSVPRGVLSDLKGMLENLLKRHPQLSNAIVTCVLERLFRNSEIKSYFSDWENNSALRSAYDEAVHLSDLAEQRRINNN